MQIAIEITDDVLTDAKRLADRLGISLEELVIDSLARRLNECGGALPESANLPTRSLGEAFVNISDNLAVRELLEHPWIARTGFCRA